jgi:putative transposase
VTPNDRHAGRDVAILAKRRQLYATAKKRTPRRWTGDTRNWTPVGPVPLNRLHPDATKKEDGH